MYVVSAYVTLNLKVIRRLQGCKSKSLSLAIHANQLDCGRLRVTDCSFNTSCIDWMKLKESGEKARLIMINFLEVSIYGFLDLLIQ